MSFLVGLPLLFEDEGVCAVAKPAGLAVHGGPKVADTLERRLVAEHGARAPAILHRLDTDTSGVLLLARTRAARLALQRGFEERSIAKTYLGLLAGWPQAAGGTIEAALVKRSSARLGWRMVVAAGGQPAVTRWRRLGRWQDGGRKGAALLLSPKTGRTHQLRVHATLIAPGAYLDGDPVYGPDRSGRLRLHARAIAFHLPSGRRARVVAPLGQGWPRISGR